MSGLRFLVVYVVVAACGGKAALPPPATAEPACAEVDAVDVADSPTRVGDRRRYESTMEFEWNEGGAKRNAVIRAVTDEKVLEVDGDVITQREVVFVEHDTAVVPKLAFVNLKGRRFVAHAGKRFTEHGVDIPQELLLSLGGSMLSGQLETNVVAGRTFQKAVMTRLGFESGVDGFGKPTATFVMLRELKETIATFDVATKYANEIETADTMTYDLARGVRIGQEGTTRVSIAGTELAVTLIEKVSYPDRPMRAVETRACADQLVTLPWVPPRVGETFTVVQTYTGQVGGKPVTVTTTSREVVRAVSDGTIAELEAQVREDGAGGAREFAYHIVWDGTSFKQTVDAQTTMKPELVARGDVGMRGWFGRIATDRTYRIGVEQRSTTELAPQLGGTHRVDVRSTLVDISAARATFRLQLRVPVELEGKTIDTVYRGTGEWDVVRGRPISVELAIDADLPGIEAQAWSQRFTYD